MADYDPVAVLRVLTDHAVEFVVIGGVAARLRGAPLLTQDIDITPRTNRPNLTALTAALRELEATLRTASEPDGVPFPLDVDLLTAAQSWTLVTNHGDVDLVFQPSGTGGFEDLTKSAETLQVAVDPPLEVRVAALEDIIRSKEAAGRDKDRAALPLLRRTLEESARHPK